MPRADDQRQALSQLEQQARRELTGILAFYGRYAIDEELGGFHGRVGWDGRPVAGADKTALATSRILWTFARCFRRLGDPELLVIADRAQQYLVTRIWDPDFGGVAPRVDASGQVVDRSKNSYIQGYALYALAEYHLATGDPDSLDRAVAIYRLLDQHMWDPIVGAYHDSRRPDWTPGRRERWGGRRFGRMSMNVQIHLLEAYSVLLQAWDDPAVRARQIALVELIVRRGHDDTTQHFRQGHDARWRPLDDSVSYGHDVETSWLLTEALGVLGDHRPTGFAEEVTARAVAVTRRCLDEALDADGALCFKGNQHGVTDRLKAWWVQAEALVACLDAFELTGDDRFLQDAAGILQFVQDRLVNREIGEWYLCPERSGPFVEADLAIGPTKDPYHNARACLETIERCGRLLAQP